eukprot:10483079-Karenia_brevis.AAC.1
MRMWSGRAWELAQEYLRYKTHTCREEYADPQRWESERKTVENDWPEYKTYVDLVSKRDYLRSDRGAHSWLHTYLHEHVQKIQGLKQNHVHVVNSKGERVPLMHCRRPDNPNKCKGDFPRTHWLIEKAVVLCRGLMKRM